MCFSEAVGSRQFLFLLLLLLLLAAAAVVVVFKCFLFSIAWLK